MFLRLFLLMTLIPLVEIYFLIQLSGVIGGGNTILLIISTGLLGAWLLRRQGASILQQLQHNASQSQLPTDAITKGFFTFIGGVLLLTPGLLTDVIGMSLIFPPTQILWRKFFLHQWARGVQSGNIRVYTSATGFGGGFSQTHTRKTRRIDHTVIDVEARDVSVSKNDEI
ncbi:MAG: FxsA family protein [Bdellovibrionales bacterium]|nr:FxsA family protein [Bdellovibrionales bacterium]